MSGTVNRRLDGQRMLREGIVIDHGEQRLLLTIPQVQKLLSLPKYRVYELLATGELPSLAIGRRTNGRARSRRITRQAVEAFIAQLEQQAAGDAA
jgi:excisionase family DNA binding protein